MDIAATDLGISEKKLVSTRWAFGAAGQPPLTESLRFTEQGGFIYYNHPNETSWRVSGSELEIYRDDGVLMWRSAGCLTQGGRTQIRLHTPHAAGLEFALIELERFGEASPATDPAVTPAPARSHSLGLSDADFLVPKDLQVTPVRIDRVLLVGSCLTSHYLDELRAKLPQTNFDFVLFNYAVEMPEQPPAPVSDYAFQMLQIPLGSVLTTRTVWVMQVNDPDFLPGILQDACTVIDAMLEAGLRYNRNHGLLTFVTNFLVPQKTAASHLTAAGSDADIVSIVRQLNDYLTRRISGLANVFLLDMNTLADSIGKRYILDDVLYYYAHGGIIYQDQVDMVLPLRIEPIPPIGSFYHTARSEFFATLFDQMVGHYRTIHQIDQVKAVIFDLDNTLWRGQIAEHYRPGQSGYHERDGWPMGLWETVHHLRARGILVAICSKNDLETVTTLWDIVVQPALVKLSDFVSVKINWKTKEENIREICQEFSLTPKSVVFVDDNPVERAAVKAALPEIRVIGSNPYLTRRILLWSPETQVARLTNESVRREEMVRNQVVREQTRTTLSRSEFLATLHCMVSFVPICSTEQTEFTRVFELVNKTNQFNTTARRWTNPEITLFLAEGGSITAFHVRDRFSDYGLVGILFSQGQEIVQFVMSCRVLGMEIELYAVAHVVQQIRGAHPGATVTATIVETKDNTPCRTVYTRSGFRTLSSATEVQRFAFGPEDVLPESSHITEGSWT